MNKFQRIVAEEQEEALCVHAVRSAKLLQGLDHAQATLEEYEEERRWLAFLVLCDEAVVQAKAQLADRRWAECCTEQLSPEEYVYV